MLIFGHVDINIRCCSICSVRRLDDIRMSNIFSYTHVFNWMQIAHKKESISYFIAANWLWDSSLFFRACRKIHIIMDIKLIQLILLESVPTLLIN